MFYYTGRMPARGKINLLPKNDFENSFFGKLVNWAVNVGRWVVVLTEFVVICAFLSRFYFDTELAKLFDNIKQNKTIVDSALGFEDTFLRTQEKIKIVKGILEGLDKPSVTFADVSRMLPLDMTLTGLSYRENKVEISGYCLSLESLNLFLWELNGSPNFEDVSITNVSQKEGSVEINFNINFSIKK